MSRMEAALYLVAAGFQFTALVFAVRMVAGRGDRRQWIALSAALGVMLVVRLIGVISVGKPEIDGMPMLRAIAALGISLLLFLSLFFVRRLAIAEKRSSAVAAKRAAERDLAEASLRASEHMMRVVQELSPNGFCVLRAVRDPAEAGRIVDFTYEYMNPAGIRHGKHDPATVVGSRLSVLSPNCMIEPEVFPRFVQAVETGQASDVELFHRGAHGSHWLRIQSMPMGGGQLAVSYIDISQQKELLGREQAARSEAERASRVKDDFLATLSHELRTPLNAILGWSQLLRTGHADDSDYAQGLETIERNARAQTQIIEDLLDMSRIITGKIRLDMQRVDPTAVVETCIATFRQAADAKGVRLTMELGADIPQIRGDAARLQQVVCNLLGNAVKFTPTGGEVRALLRRVDTQVQITVSDNGQGISREFLPHIFERFRQQDSSTTRRHAGLGLGLSIVKQLVELHGGTVSAESAGEGRGATFTVMLPAIVEKNGPVRPAQGRPSDDAQGRPFEGAHGGPDRGEVPSSAIAGAPTTGLRGVKILVVDDEADARELMKRVLDTCDAQVLIASSAAEAMEMLKKERPSVLVSDIGMPGKDGYELMREIRALPREQGGETVGIALTAFARAEDRSRAMLAGYQVHIAKPIEPGELIAALADVSGRIAGGEFSRR